MEISVGAGRVVLGLRDVAVREHRAQNLVAAGDGIARALERIEQRGRLWKPCEQGRLGQGQVRRPLGEVRLRRCLDAVRAIAVEDLVDVALQDPVLRLLARELDRETRLRGFPPERLGRLLDVQVARELLRDRRSALHDVSRLDVCEQRAHDAGIVERAVRPETTVLDRDGRPGHPLAHRGQGDRLPVLLRRDRAEQRTVGRIDERVLSDVDGPQRVEVAARHPDRGTGEAGDHEREQRPHDADGHEPAEPLTAAQSPPSPLAADRGGQILVAPRTRPWSPGGAHAKTPSARSAACARRRRSCSSRSAAGSSAAAARITTVASPAREVTKTSAAPATTRSRSTIASRS